MEGVGIYDMFSIGLGFGNNSQNPHKLCATVSTDAMFTHIININSKLLGTQEVNSKLDGTPGVIEC